MEALIHCRRYDDALQGVQGLRPGVDRLYLEAECRWRQGDPGAASVLLEVCTLEDFKGYCKLQDPRFSGMSHKTHLPHRQRTHFILMPAGCGRRH